MQYVEIELDPGETAIAESGAFMMMDDGIQMANHIRRRIKSTTGISGKINVCRKTGTNWRKPFHDSVYQYCSGKEES